MNDVCWITVNGKRMQVAPGTSVAAAMMMAQLPCRLSVCGQPRGPVCGMGICMECRAIVDRVPHRRTCQLICVAGMEVETA